MKCNRLQRNQGCNKVVSSHLYGRAQTTQDPRQRHQPWSYRDTDVQWRGRAVHDESYIHRADGADGKS
jgi:hypothetical protein